MNSHPSRGNRTYYLIRRSNGKQPVISLTLENTVTCNRNDEPVDSVLRFSEKLRRLAYLCFSARDTRYTLAPAGHVIHIEHATPGAYVSLLYHGSLTCLISLLVQP